MLLTWTILESSVIPILEWSEREPVARHVDIVYLPKPGLRSPTKSSSAKCELTRLSRNAESRNAADYRIEFAKYRRRVTTVVDDYDPTDETLFGRRRPDSELYPAAKQNVFRFVHFVFPCVNSDFVFPPNLGSTAANDVPSDVPARSALSSSTLGRLYYNN